MELLLCWTHACRPIGVRLHQALMPSWDVDVADLDSMRRGAVPIPSDIPILAVGGAPVAGLVCPGDAEYQALGVTWWTERNATVFEEGASDRGTAQLLDSALFLIETEARSHAGPVGTPGRERMGAALALDFLHPSLGPTAGGADMVESEALELAYLLAVAHFLVHGFDGLRRELAPTARPAPPRGT